GADCRRDASGIAHGQQAAEGARSRRTGRVLSRRQRWLPAGPPGRRDFAGRHAQAGAVEAKNRRHRENRRGHHRMNSMISESSSAATLRDNADVAEVLGRTYSAGFITRIEMTGLPPGLDEGTVRA